jgi:hypothetical protein
MNTVLIEPGHTVYYAKLTSARILKITQDGVNILIKNYAQSVQCWVAFTHAVILSQFRYFLYI